VRRSPLRRVSTKQSARLRIYAKLRTEYLSDHPACQWPQCPCLATEIHHKEGRFKNLNVTSTWSGLCHAHHVEVHSHPAEARAMGLLK